MKKLSIVCLFLKISTHKVNGNNKQLRTVAASLLTVATSLVCQNLNFLTSNFSKFSYTVFRQAFLLIQYSFICKQYFFCSDRVYQYFFWQMVNKTAADCFNNIVLVVKISRKNLLKKMENNSTLQKILWVFNRNAKLLRLVGATFYSKVASLRRLMKKNLIILKNLQKRKLLLMVIFCRCLHLSCQISIESVRNIFICSLNILITVLYLKFFSIL